MALLGASGFDPITRTYDSGAGTETIPNGASQVAISVWGAGGRGGDGDIETLTAGGGAGSGGYVLKTFTLTASDWGKTFSYVVGSASGGNSTVVNGTFGTSTNLAANGGSNGNDGNVGGLQGTGGTASGGDTNTAGNPTSPAVSRSGSGAPNGGGNTAADVGTTPGGGGAGGSLGGSSGQVGANGRVQFAYT